MKRRILPAVLAGALAACFLVPAPALAETPPPWIHVQVHDRGGKTSRVQVNLPLAVVQALVEISPERILSHARIQLGEQGGELKVSDLRRVWRELRDSGEAELLKVEEEDEIVTVTKRGGRLQIAADRPTGKEVVRVDVPVAVVDALLAGEGERLNLRQAFAELEKLRGEIVRVEDEESRVRIWIDERN